VSDDQPGAPFEEQAALAELERLQRAIEDSQRRRRHATDAFDSFMRSLDGGAAAQPEVPPGPPASEVTSKPPSAPPVPAAGSEQLPGPPVSAATTGLPPGPPASAAASEPPPAPPPPGGTSEQLPGPPTPAVGSEQLPQPPVAEARGPALEPAAAASAPGASKPVVPAPHPQLSARTDLDVFPLEKAPDRPRETLAAERGGPVTGAAITGAPMTGAPLPPPAPPLSTSIGERHVPAALAPPAGPAAGRMRALAVVAMLVALVLVSAVLFLRRGSNAEVAAPQAAAGPATSAGPAGAPPSPARTALSAPAAARAPAAGTPVPRAELVTLRRVWLRVLVDGERAVERELEADVRLPFNVGQRLVVRTGDAGAVRLEIGGKDQGTLGRDGEVVTRTFTLPAAAAPRR
jgi:hypothetical protein